MALLMTLPLYGLTPRRLGSTVAGRRFIPTGAGLGEEEHPLPGGPTEGESIMQRGYACSLALAGALATGMALCAEGAGGLQPVEARGRATLKGKITLKGPDPAPRLAELTRDLQGKMGSHQDKACCLAGKPEE